MHPALLEFDNFNFDNSQLNSKNVSIAIVGKGQPFTIYDDSKVETWLDLLSPNEKKGRSSGGSGDSGPGGSDDMDTQPPQGPQPTAAVALDDRMAVD